MIKKINILLVLYFFAGAACFCPRPWSRSRLKKISGPGAAWENNQEPEPLGKSSGVGKKLSGSSALRPPPQSNDLVQFYSSYFTFILFPTTLVDLIYFL